MFRNVPAFLCVEERGGDTVVVVFLFHVFLISSYVFQPHVSGLLHNALRGGFRSLPFPAFCVLCTYRTLLDALRVVFFSQFNVSARTDLYFRPVIRI